MIYLDNAATTRVFDKAAHEAVRALTQDFFNPSSLYSQAYLIRKKLDDCRKTVADYLNVQSEQIYFTSGASESNNWALRKGIKNKSGNIIISAGEHASVYETAMDLKSQGIEVKIAPLKKDGTVNLEKLLQLIDQKTALISLIHLSNETGAVNPVSEAVKLIKSVNPQIIVHSDGAQAFLKTDCDLIGLGVDLYSGSSHKIGAPKGAGFLYVKKGFNIAPYLTGGGQEKGMRSGTENVPAIIGFACAAKEFAAIDLQKIKALKSVLLNNIKNEFSDSVLIVSSENSSDFILTVCFKNLKAEVLANMLNDRGVLIGTGSACASAKRGNRILTAMGINENFSEGALRFSFGAFNTKQEINEASQIIIDTVKDLRAKYV